MAEVTPQIEPNPSQTPVEPAQDKKKNRFLLILSLFFVLIMFSFLLYFLLTLEDSPLQYLLKPQTTQSQKQTTQSAEKKQSTLPAEKAEATETAEDFILFKDINSTITPALKVSLKIPKEASSSMVGDNTGIRVATDNFELLIGLVREAVGGIFYKIPDFTTIYNSHFKSPIKRFRYMDANAIPYPESPNKYYYDNNYRENTDGQCDQFNPKPVACSARMMSPFDICCTSSSKTGLSQCDRVVETLDYSSLYSDTLEWKRKTFDIEYENAAEKLTMKLSVELPKDWKTETTNREESEELIKNCSTFIFYSPDNLSKTTLAPVCVSWGANYFPWSSEYVLVLKQYQYGNEATNKYRVRYTNAKNTYNYVDGNMDLSFTLNEVGKSNVIDAITIGFSAPNDEKHDFLYVPANLTLEYFGKESDRENSLQITDRIAASLRLED